MRNVNRPLLLLIVTAVLALPVAAAAGDAVRIAYIGQERVRPPVLSNLDTHPQDEGLAGALLGVTDNNATGKFTGHLFDIEIRQLAIDDSPAEAVNELVAAGVRYFVLDLVAASIKQILDRVDASDALFFNAGATDRSLRDDACHPQLLHTALSRDMQANALAQFLVKKRWREWLLVTGPRSEDQLFADAVTRSARKFGAKIVEQKKWDGNFDARRVARAEVPLFTKGVDYDVLIVADEAGDFGNFLMFQTFDPRPVAGTQGLVAQAWGRPLEQWGAAQLQERFLKNHRRWMRSRDYAAWLGVRAVGEGVLRSTSPDARDVGQYIRSDQFQLAGFKGRKMNFRTWNGQLRQPVPLMWSSALVAQAPIEGFLHRRTELDTLGLDSPESACKL